MEALLPLPHSGRAAVAPMVLASLLAHGLLFTLVARARPAPKPRVESIEFEVAPRPPPLPPPPAAADPTPTPTPAPTPAARPARPRAVRDTPPPTPAAPQPRAATPPDDGPPPPMRIGISLGSTTNGGGFAVGVGNSLMGTADHRAADPTSVRPLTGAPGPAQPAFVSAARVSTLPKLLEQPKADYPPEARKAGIEGRVVLALAIDASGRVSSARVVEGLGYGLDEAAREAARRFRFAPATLDGAPVGTEIRFTYTFLLE